jgi:hypothetical protein
METIKKFSDKNLVAYLLAKEFKESALPELDHGRVFFSFDYTPELEQETLNFYGGHSLVDAQAYAYHMRRLAITASEMHKGGGQNV